MKVQHHERHLIELLLVMLGVPPERARADAFIVEFLLRPRRGRAEAQASPESVPDPRGEVQDLRGVQYAWTRVRACLQRLLSFVSLTSRAS